ncbi:endonuclease/exonuclease/phosphatase family protein [Phocaeicola sp.]|jgi:endonuclease/exonuclease/phosphatase family metal-dependent hydrolase|uniref:endonuclease/exonuclease/phosphatase family protein n=1 Tax=Phocaeicola sp. TaxID=2773926 RepID=UPI002852D08E|nr:endonuclease/exonuclease/phosphatase family protein [Phocaeicola sp.]
MNILGHTVKGVLLLGNVGVGIGFLCCAYSPSMSPVAHPILSCAGLFFPFLLLSVLVFIPIWFFYCRKYVWVPLIFLVAGGGAILTYTPFRSAEETAEGEVLKFLTYNVMGMQGDTEDESHPIQTYIQQSDADVVCLQEFHWDNEKIKKEFPMYPYVRSLEVGNGNKMGCLSRFPILSVEPVVYKSVTNGSFILRLKMESDTLVVVCNHLESNKLDAHDKEVYEGLLKSPEEQNVKADGKYLLRKLADAAVIRAPQADSVAQAISRQSSKYLMVCGDFNDSPISYAHHTIGRGLTDAYREAGWGPGFSYNRNFLYFRIDHMFVNKGFRVLKCRVDNSISASDHYPLWCLVEKL